MATDNTTTEQERCTDPQGRVQALVKTPSAQVVVDAFFEMREQCEHYTGIKDDWADVQCTRADNYSAGSCCGMDACPILHTCAAENSAGWD